MTPFAQRRTQSRTNLVNTSERGDTLTAPNASWGSLRTALTALDSFVNDKNSYYADFEDDYRKSSSSAEDWADPRLKSVLSIFRTPNGVRTFQGVKDQHSANTTSDYAEDIVADLKAGKLVIFDQSTGSPELNVRAAERIMWKVFKSQQAMFTAAESRKPGKGMCWCTWRKHTLLPRGASRDVLSTVWATCRQGKAAR